MREQTLDDGRLRNRDRPIFRQSTLYPLLVGEEPCALLLLPEKSGQESKEAALITEWSADLG